MLHPSVVRNDEVATRTVVKHANDAGMRAAKDADDAAFHAASRGAAGGAGMAAALDSDEDVVAMHGVFDTVPRNEDVAVHFRDGYGGNDEAVTVLVKHQAAFDFITALRIFPVRPLSLRRAGFDVVPLVAASQLVTIAGQLLDGAAFF
ncbi:MAG: hypothetical protein PVS2B2_02480 [Candidatus Acidiferrum sp.]